MILKSNDTIDYYRDINRREMSHQRDIVANYKQCPNCGVLLQMKNPGQYECKCGYIK